MGTCPLPAVDTAQGMGCPESPPQRTQTSLLVFLSEDFLLVLRRKTSSESRPTIAQKKPQATQHPPGPRHPSRSPGFCVPHAPSCSAAVWQHRVATMESEGQSQKGLTLNKNKDIERAGSRTGTRGRCYDWKPIGTRNRSWAGKEMEDLAEVHGAMLGPAHRSPREHFPCTHS